MEQPEESVFERAITAKDIVKYSSEEIDAIQKEYDKENCREIFQAYVEHRINQEEVLFLLNYYRDGMKAYREVYRGLYEIYGIPEQIACMNQLNGELEMHIQKIPHVDAKKNRIITVRENVVTNYSLKEVTPFTCMRLEYRDNENNPVYVILPVMKKARRAIEKFRIIGSNRWPKCVKSTRAFSSTATLTVCSRSLPAFAAILTASMTFCA